MTKPQLPREFVKLCKKVTAKRPRTVIEHILKHGFITTQELKDKYGYNHPPRAVRDVKENGIPIEWNSTPGPLRFTGEVQASVHSAAFGRNQRIISRRGAEHEES